MRTDGRKGIVRALRLVASVSATACTRPRSRRATEAWQHRPPAPRRAPARAPTRRCFRFAHDRVLVARFPTVTRQAERRSDPKPGSMRERKKNWRSSPLSHGHPTVLDRARYTHRRSQLGSHDLLQCAFWRFFFSRPGWTALRVDRGSGPMSDCAPGPTRHQRLNLIALVHNYCRYPPDIVSNDVERAQQRRCEWLDCDLRSRSI